MSWIRIDDTFPDHPKCRRVGLAGIGLHIGALCYSARLLTDGIVPRAQLPFLTGQPMKASLKLADEMVAAGLWEQAGDDYALHDYLEYNPSRADVMERRAKESARKRQGIREESARNTYGVGAESANLPRAPLPIPIPSPDEDTSRLSNDLMIPITTGPNSPGNAEHLINYEKSRRGRVSKATENGLPSSEELERRRNDPAWDAREH